MAITEKLIITENDKNYLESLVRSRTVQAQIAQRARIILFHFSGGSPYGPSCDFAFPG